MCLLTLLQILSGLKFTPRGNKIIFTHNRYYNANIAYTALNTVFVVFQSGTGSIKELGSSV